MASLNRDAEYYRLGLLSALLPSADVIAWADRTIAKQHSPSIELLDLSVCSTDAPVSIVVLLDRIAGECDSEGRSDSLHRVFGLLHTSVVLADVTHREAAMLLGSLASFARYVPDEDMEFIWWIEAEYGLVEQGIMDSGRAEVELLRFLGQFSAEAGGTRE